MATTKIKTVNTDFRPETDALQVPVGTTAQRASTSSGAFRFNSTNNIMEYYDGTAWISLEADPTVASISPIYIVEDGSTVTTVTITGTNFKTGATVALIPDDSSGNVAPGTVSFVSGTEITFQCTAGQLSGGVKDPWDVKVTNPSNLFATLTNALDVNPTPAFDQAAGSLGTVADTARTSLSFDASATDEGVPLSATNAYAIASGSLYTGGSLNTTTGEITGDASAVGSDTTSNFTISATDTVNTNHRAFSITVNAPVIQTFTADTTWTVPTGLTQVEALVIGGGGGGGYDQGGGGGGGGWIYYSTLALVPAGTITVDVGAGGPGPSPSGSAGTAQDSVFGNPSDPGISAPQILTAKGGGGGGSGAGDGGHNNGGDGGSGGGPSWRGNHMGHPPGAAIQNSEPGISGQPTIGFGHAGGSGGGAGGRAGGSGGGAGAVGTSRPSTGTTGAPGGVGKVSTITGSPVYYSGGGGGAGGQPTGAGGGGGGQGGGAHGASPGAAGAAGANTGGGGGGQSPTKGAGSPGADGIIILKY